MKVLDIISYENIFEGKKKRKRRRKMPAIFSKRARGGFGTFYGGYYGGGYGLGWGNDSGAGDGGDGGDGGGGGE